MTDDSTAAATLDDAADPSWRRVRADFGETPITTHNRLQHYNFDSDNLLVRHDYWSPSTSATSPCADC